MVRGSCEPTGTDSTCTSLIDRWPLAAAEKACEATRFRQSTYCTGYNTAGGCKGDGAIFGAPGYAYTRWYYLDLGKGGYTEEEVPALCAASDPPLEPVPPD